MKDLHNPADSNSRKILLINPFSVKRAFAGFDVFSSSLT